MYCNGFAVVCCCRCRRHCRHQTFSSSRAATASWGLHSPLKVPNSSDARAIMSIGPLFSASSLKDANSPGSSPELNGKQRADKRSSSFDILSKWYIDGELEHRHNLHTHEKNELIKEIERLGQRNYALRLEKRRERKKVRLVYRNFRVQGRKN